MQIFFSMKKPVKNIIAKALRFKTWSRKNFAVFNSLRHTVIIARTSAKVADRLTGMNGVSCPVVFTVLCEQFHTLAVQFREQQSVLCAVANTSEPDYCETDIYYIL